MFYLTRSFLVSEIAEDDTEKGTLRKCMLDRLVFVCFSRKSE